MRHQTWKKTFSAFLAVLLLVMSIPMTAVEVDAAGRMTLAELQAKFPHGKYWNHAGNPGASNSVNNQDGWTNTPCSVHGVVSTSKQTCNGFAPNGTQLSWQCMGYAEKLGYDFTGYNPRDNANGWYTYGGSSALDSLKPGDIVRYKNNGHSIFVTAVNGDTVTYTDCNDGNSSMCKIRWGATISKSTLKSTFTHVRSAPYSISGGATTTHTVDSAYGTNFTAYPKAKITAENIFDANHYQISSSSWIGTSDNCTIHEVYTDGCCKVSYPLDSGGTKTVYSKIALFNVETPSYHVDIGTNFTAPIINLASWRIIETNNGVVQTAVENGKSNQLWYFERQSDGSYKIYSCSDGSCLDVNGASSEAYAKVQVWGSNDSDAQRWYIYEQDGGYVLKAKCTDCVLDMPENDPTPGNQLIMYHRNNTGAQIWSIYRGNECKLSAPALSVNAGSSTTNTTFTWNEVYGENCYDIYIWKNKKGEGDAYHFKWGATSGYSVQLPYGYYEAIVFTGHYYESYESNIVSFTVNPSYTIAHWAGGFKNGEGDNGEQNMKWLGSIPTPSVVGETYILNYDKAIQNIPNGYYVRNVFVTPAISDEWEAYSMGTTVTQKAGDMYYEYYYDPTTYSITYNLNGGTNASSNPSTYNVLYGFTLANPTREGYTFAGWTDANGNRVYGINAGKNADFAINATYEELCSELASRTTGDMVLTANWVANTYTVKYDANNGVFDVADQTKTHDVELTLSDSIPILDGYTFLGWSTDPMAETAEYQPGDAFTVDADTTLYAVWSAILDVEPGDVDGDGDVDTTDAAALYRYLKGANVTVSAGADANGDGSVDNLDYSMLERIIKGVKVN